jgi:hypothetical protein
LSGPEPLPHPPVAALTNGKAASNARSTGVA